MLLLVYYWSVTCSGLPCGAFMHLVRKKLAVLALMTSGFACADEVTFSLTTTGQFSPSNWHDLEFQGLVSPGFFGTTSTGSFLLTDLGTFTLFRPTQGADPYQRMTFALDIDFSAPGGIIGMSSFAAELSGTVNTQHGEVLIDFGPAHHFTFSNAAGSGAFDLAINDVTLSMLGPHSDVDIVSQALTGTISNAFDPPATDALGPTVVPEPLSAVLLGTALLLMVRFSRQRVRSAIR